MIVPRYVLDGVAAAIGEAADAIGGNLAPALKADAGDLVETPATLAGRVAAAIGATPSLEHLADLAEDGPALTPAPSTTAQRQIQGRSQDKLAALVRQLAAIEVAERAGVAGYADRSALLEARERATDLLDDAAETADDPLYRDLRELRAALVEHLAQRAPALARTVTTEELAGLPSLVASYRLYGDVASAADIAARNALPRPGFIPRGKIEIAIRD